MYLHYGRRAVFTTTKFAVVSESPADAVARLSSLPVVVVVVVVAQIVCAERAVASETRCRACRQLAAPTTTAVGWPLQWAPAAAAAPLPW